MSAPKAVVEINSYQAELVKDLMERLEWHRNKKGPNMQKPAIPVEGWQWVADLARKMDIALEQMYPPSDRDYDPGDDWAKPDCMY